VKSSAPVAPTMSKADAAAQAQKAKADSLLKADATAYKTAQSSPEYQRTQSELTKALGTSPKTYGSRTEATTDLRNQIAAKNAGFADGSSRPTYVPATYTVGGAPCQTVLVGGRWGYYDPLTHAFVAYSTAHFVVSDMMPYSWGYHPTYVTAAPMSGRAAALDATVVVLMLLFAVFYGVWKAKQGGI